MWGARTSEGVHHCLQRPHDLLAEQWEVILGEEGLQVLPLQTVAQLVGQAHHLGEERLLEQGEGRLCRRPTLALHHSSHPAHAQEPGQQLRHLHQMETRAAARAGVMGRGVSPHPWHPGPQGGATAILKQVIPQLNWHKDLNPTIPLPSRRSRAGRARPRGPVPIPHRGVAGHCHCPLPLHADPALYGSNPQPSCVRAQWPCSRTVLCSDTESGNRCELGVPTGALQGLGGPHCRAESHGGKQRAPRGRPLPTDVTPAWSQPTA